MGDLVGTCIHVNNKERLVRTKGLFEAHDPLTRPLSYWRRNDTTPMCDIAGRCILAVICIRRNVWDLLVHEMRKKAFRPNHGQDERGPHDCTDPNVIMLNPIVFCYTPSIFMLFIWIIP